MGSTHEGPRTFPSPNAPHIRVGRIDHAIDVNSLDGGETRLQRWLEEQSCRPSNPVRGEAWHMELTATQLRRLAARLDVDDTPPLRKGMKPNRAAVRRLQKWLRALNVKVPLNGRYDLATRAGVKRWQRRNGIPTDSNATVGDVTWRKLKVRFNTIRAKYRADLRKRFEGGGTAAVMTKIITDSWGYRADPRRGGPDLPAERHDLRDVRRHYRPCRTRAAGAARPVR